MRFFLLFLLLIPLTATAKEKKGYCKEGTTYEMRECAFNKLVQSDIIVKRELNYKTFQEWVRIRQRMCEEAHMQYTENSINPIMILTCSIEMNETMLKKTRGFN